MIDSINGTMMGFSYSYLLAADIVNVLDMCVDLNSVLGFQGYAAVKEELVL